MRGNALKFQAMEYSELSERNFQRIWLINWALTPAMLILFAWPYYLLCTILNTPDFIAWGGAAIFASPFMMTVLHGHVTMAMGALHRHHYYEWLRKHPFSYGIFFHPIMFRTRFRLMLVAIGLSLIPLSRMI